MIPASKISFILLCLLHLGADGINPLLATTNECSHTFHARSRTFSSPSYNSYSRINETCNWRISASPDEKIVLSITNIDIEKSADCRFGEISVWDGYWRSSPSLGRFCGSGPLWPIISTGNRMLISYVNRNTTGHRGFFARYEALCGGEIFVEDNFTLKSPSVFGKYPPDKKCIWRIIVPEGRQVALNFQRFDLEEERNCSYDYLRILDGNSSRRFCGDKIPLDIVSTSNNLTVIFATDASVQKNGFLATVQGEWDECTIRGHECAHSCVNTIGSYRCVCDNGYQLLPDGKNCEQRCGGTLLNSRGTIRSPSSPSNDTCVWEIITSADNLIVLNFTHFDVEGENVVNSTEGWCGRARLEIFSENGNQSVLQGLYCGSILPDALLSQENKVRIVFTSYHQVQGTGFVLDYYTVKNHCSFYNGNCHHNCINTVTNSPKCTCSNNYTLQENGLDCKKDCYHEIASTSGNITSPNYPLNYGNNDFCSWLFKTTPGHKIQVEFLNFAMESGTNCPFDYVALYDGTPSNSSLARVCGSGSNRKENSTINKLHMVFKSDHSNVFRGFQANYSTICGGTFQVSTQENHIFSHAKYGVSTYDNSSDCTWTINPLPGYNTSLTVEAFDLEFSATCTFDSVQIIEGAAVYGTFCGSKGIPGRFVSFPTKPLEEIVSAYPIAIRLRTDGSVSAEGFRIMYKAINA